MKPLDDKLRARLLKFLDDGEWHTWRDIKAATGCRRDDVRGDPLFLDGYIIGHAQFGVKLTEHATDDELDHAIASLRSRATEITQRASALTEWR